MGSNTGGRAQGRHLNPFRAHLRTAKIKLWGIGLCTTRVAGAQQVMRPRVGGEVTAAEAIFV